MLILQILLQIFWEIFWDLSRKFLLHWNKTIFRNAKSLFEWLSIRWESIRWIQSYQAKVMFPKCNVVSLYKLIVKIPFINLQKFFETDIIALNKSCSSSFENAIVTTPRELDSGLKSASMNNNCIFSKNLAFLFRVQIKKWMLYITKNKVCWFIVCEIDVRDLYQCFDILESTICFILLS